MKRRIKHPPNELVINSAKNGLEKYKKIYKKTLEKTLKDIEFEIKKFTLEKKIIENKNNIWCPSIDTDYKNINDKFWFNIHETEKHSVQHKCTNHTLIGKENVECRVKKVNLDLTGKQKKIIDKWIYLFGEMYNIALKYIKNTIKTDKKCLCFEYARSKLYGEKTNLIRNSNIKVHDIDYAIKLACSNYKSALTNLRKGYIKKFRIRYWSPNKTIKIMDLEKDDFGKNTIRKNILGVVKGYYDGKKFNFNSIKHDCVLQKNGNDYYLYVPINVKKTEKNEKQNKNIAIDLGIRTFATCISENKAIKIGENCSIRITKYLKRKDNILRNEKISAEIKKKNELMINKKINNLVEELHWQSINYLVKNYETILIGDLNVKSIIRKDGNLSKMTKRVTMCLKFFNFKKKLKYKCNVNDTNLGIIDEWFTSKMCSLCGNTHKNLGGNKVYDCEKCKCSIDRDINGARNIYIKSIS